MVREQMKQRHGKFLLETRTFGKPMYLYEVGTANVGTPDEQSYLNWTRYANEAQGFETAKTARAMVERLSLYGYDGAVMVCMRKGGQERYGL